MEPVSKLQAEAERKLRGFGVSNRVRDAVLVPSNLAMLEEALRLSGEGKDVSQLNLQEVAGSATEKHDQFFGGVEPATSRLGPFEGFIKSAVSAGGQEMIGLEAMEGVEEWRAENPWKALGSEILGITPSFAVGFAAGPRIAARLPFLGSKYAGLLKSAEAIEGAFARGAVREVVRLAPLEIGLIGGGAGASLAKQDARPIERTLSRAMTDFALIGATGGVLTKIPTVRPFSRIQVQGEERIQRYVEPEYVVGASPHDKLKKLVTLEGSPKWQTLDEADQITVSEVAAQLKKQIRVQEPVRGKQAPVSPLVSGDSKKVSELFRVGKSPRGFTGYFPEPTQVNPKVWAEFGLRFDLETKPNWEVNTQFFRFLKADTDAGSMAIQRTIRENLVEVVGNKVWMGKEADGAYVMAFKLKGKATPPKAKTPTGKEGDLFAVLKTDAPAIYTPEAAKFGGALAEHAFKFREEPILTGALRNVPLAREVDELVSEVFPSGAVKGTEKQVSGILSKMVGREGAEDISAAGEVLKEGAKTYLAPSITRYTASPTATRLSNIARATFAKATAHAHDLFYGKPTVKRSGSLTREIFKARPETTGGILPFIERMETIAGEEGAAQFTRAVTSGMSPAEAKAVGMNYTVVEVLRKLEKVDKPLFAQTQAVYEAAGRKEISPLANHFMMVRGWKGDTRLDIHMVKPDGTRGAKIGIASGKDASEAVREAKILQKVLESEGKKVTFDPKGTYPGTRELDVQLAAGIDWSKPEAKALRFAQANRIATAGEPGRFKPRGEVRGFLGDLRAMTYKEIKDATLASVKGMMNTQAEVLLRDLYLGDELLRLRAAHGSLFGKAEFPQIAEAIDRMINLFMGRQTPMSQMINKATDRILAPVLGSNSASKIGYAMNKTMGTLTLGALDLGFPTMNAVTWVQTVLPEIAFVLKSPSKSLEPYYSPLLVRGRQTGFGMGWHLEPLKLAVRAFKSMHNPDAVLRSHYRDALRESIINPKFAEEFLGEMNTSAIKALQQGDLVSFLDAANKWLPGRSEEFSRLHSFTVGHLLGKDFLKLEGEKLFQFAKMFTERTMYNYGVMDRAAMITGPLGSPFGLFKNWTMHYLWNLGAYAKQGFQQGNWSPFLWAMAGTWSVAGAMGVPGYFIADGMSRVLTDKSLVVNLYDQWGDMADVAAFGLPAFLDVTTAGRADAPGADMVRDVNGLLGVATLKRIRDAGDFVGDSIDRWRVTGQWPFESQASRDKFFLAFAPRTAQRIRQTVGRDVVRSMRTQNAIVDGLSLSDSLVFGFTGFQSVDMAKAFEADSEMWKNNERRKKVVQTFGDEIGAAMDADDQAALNVLWTQALQRNAPLDAIARSAAANLRARQETAETRRGNLPANIEIRQKMLGRDLTLEQR